jgi:hypothetical protein
LGNAKWDYCMEKTKYAEVTQPDVLSIIVQFGGVQVGDWVRMNLKGKHGNMGMQLKYHRKWLRVTAVHPSQETAPHRPRYSYELANPGYLCYDVHIDGWRRELK